MTPLTREQIAGLRELLAKATPGPWRCNDGPEGYQHRLWVDLTETAFVTVCDVRNTSDAALLAAMHEALPALLDIAEAVANAQTFEAAPSDCITGCEVTIPLPMGTRIAVFALAGDA